MNFFSNKKILVTGGTGHLGSNLIHCLVGQMNVTPESIRVFYLPGSPVDSLKDIKGLDFFAGNILDKTAVNKACEGVQLVFHMVGLTTFDPRQKKLQWLVNVEGTRNVLEAVRNSTIIEKMCYTSTVNALGIPSPLGSIGNFENSNPYKNKPALHSFKSSKEILAFAEDVRQQKTDNWWKRIGIGYYDSKLAAQELVNEYVSRYGLNVVSVLPGTMFGPYDHFIGTSMFILSLYHNQIPGVLTGGMPACHIIDVAEGHALAMEKAQRGSQYIMSGFEEDNRYLKDLAAIVVEGLQQKFPHKKFKAPGMVIPQWLGLMGAFVSEQYAKVFNRPMVLSRDAIYPGALPSFYTYKNAERDLGYKPKRSFRQAVEDMIDYSIKENLLEIRGRFIDKR